MQIETKIWKRFWKYVNKTSTCWLWVGGTSNGRYPGFSYNGKTVRANRFLMEGILKRKLTDDEKVLHKCDTPMCVNPKHLFVGTTQDNINDKMQKGHYRQGFGSIGKTCKDFWRCGHPRTEENSASTGRGYFSCKLCHRRNNSK